MAKFRHSFGQLSIVAAYAPTEEASEQEKAEFYTNFEQS
jgi:hypothetical protein